MCSSTSRFSIILMLGTVLSTIFLVSHPMYAQRNTRTSQVKPKIWDSPVESTTPSQLKPATQPATMPTAQPETAITPTVPPLEILPSSPISQPVESPNAEPFLDLMPEDVSEMKQMPEMAETPKTQENTEPSTGWSLNSITSPSGIQGALMSFLLLSAVSIAPAFVMMTTSFLRIFVVLCILRHGFGTQGIPGTQVLAALALFMTFFLMFPIWQRTWNDAVIPYQSGELTAEVALQEGLKPLRGFMSTQLENTGNTEEILLFWRYSSTPPEESRLAEYTSDDVPTHVLLPAFMLSELKTAFLMGVQLLIPMLVIDLLVSAILVSMGMFMLPPTVVSLPLKLLLFVLADGWRLVVEMLLVSFRQI